MDKKEESSDALVGDLQELKRDYAALQVKYDNLLEAKIKEDALVQNFPSSFPLLSIKV